MGHCSACDSVFIEKILMHLRGDVNLHLAGLLSATVLDCRVTTESESGFI